MFLPHDKVCCTYAISKWCFSNPLWKNFSIIKSPSPPLAIYSSDSLCLPLSGFPSHQTWTFCTLSSVHYVLDVENRLFPSCTQKSNVFEDLCLFSVFSSSAAITINKSSFLKCNAYTWPQYSIGGPSRVIKMWDFSLCLSGQSPIWTSFLIIWHHLLRFYIGQLLNCILKNCFLSVVPDLIF